MTDKRILRHALAIALTFAGVAALPGALSAQQRHGDVNGDRVVSALDAQAILTAVVGLPLPAGYVVANGDSNCDETTGALDAQIVLSFVIGLSTSQHCVGQNFGPGTTVVEITPGNDTSLLVNRGIGLRAILRDPEGFLIQRPVTWQTSNADLVTIDSARGDTAWVSNHFTTTGAADASATISAFSDGSASARVIRVFRSYEGIVIIPQRPDTLRQLNGTTNFYVRSRDSLGVLSDYPNAVWSIGNAAIASVPATVTYSQNVTALTMGNTFLFATSQTNPLVRDSVRLTVQLPALNSCTGTGGTLHASNVYTTAQTWSPSTNPHYLTGTQDFNAGSRLTIEPGTLICTDGGFIIFRANSRLTAVGTVAAPIIFKPTNPAGTWSGIQFGDFVGYVATPLADTSVLTNVELSRSASGYGAVNGREQHVVLMDSVRIRQSYYAGVALMSPGSRMIRSRIDTLVNDYVGYYGATLGRATLEASTIRLGSLASAVQINEASTVRQVIIVGGTQGLVQTASVAGARLNDISISGTAGVAIDLPYGLIHATSGNVQVSGGTGGAFRGQIGNLARLFPDSVAQQTLLGNGRDTIIVTGGTAIAGTVEARPDLPWRVDAMTQFDTLSQLRALPGSHFGFYYGGFSFTGGGTLNAVGTAEKFIRFEPAQAGTFYGLRFNSPGAGGIPANAPIAVSRLSYVRLDSAQGQGANDGIGYNGAISSGRRHRLEVDSAVIRLSYYAAASISAPGSYIRRSVIDTTGPASSNFLAVQPALVLGDSTLVENTLVRRSGQNGIYAPGTGVDLRNVRVVASQGTALWLEGGILAATTTNVRADSANGYPFHGRIENLAILAGTAASQAARFVGNVDSLIIVTGGNLTNATLEAHPDLRWQVNAQTYVDTLAQFRPSPRTNLTFQNGGLIFQRGGTLNAVGTPTAFIRFQPVGANAFYGLRFDSPGAGGIPANAPISVSTLNYVQIDSAQGQSAADGIGYSGAISSGRRHRLEVDSAVIRKSYYAAASIAAPGSYIRRSVIDTTGPASGNFVSSQPALVLGDTTQVQNTLVRRSGQNGIYALGTGVDLRNVRVVASRGTALWVENGILATTTTNVHADSANGYPFHGRIENLAILAGTAAFQAAHFVRNVDSLIIVTGGNLTNATLEAHPDLRWQVNAQTYVDTLAQFRPLPGMNLTFQNGGLIFQRGGTLNAVGTPTNFIRFRPVGSNAFYGLRFDSPGAGGIPANAPIAVSTLNYVQIDSAQGQGATDGIGYNGAISSGRRHRLEVDSAVIRKSYYAAASIAAPGSYIRRSVIDTTGPASGNFVSSQPALILGDTTQVENTLVRRSGQNGIYTPGTGVDLRNVRVVASRGTALWLEGGILAPTTTNVRADSANGYPFHGRIENLARVARAAATQATNFVGNVDSVIVVTGGTLTADTIEAHRDLRWRVENVNLQIGAQAHLRPMAGARLTFLNGGLYFLSGGTMRAEGTLSDSIYFSPSSPGQTFYGLRFDDATTVDFPSVISYARIDSASGQSVSPGFGFGGSAAVNASTTHVLHVGNTRIWRSRTGALFLGASGSGATNVVVDTTGTGAGFIAPYAAVALNDNTQANNLVVRRSGSTGVYVDGQNISLTGTRIVDSRGVGLHVANNSASGSQGASFSGFIVDSTASIGVWIDVSGVQLATCSVLSSMSHGFYTSSSLTGVSIQSCNILDNGRNGTDRGVENFGTTAAYLINATNNFWGLDGAGAPITPTIGGMNGVSLFVDYLPVLIGPVTVPPS